MCSLRSNREARLGRESKERVACNLHIHLVISVTFELDLAKFESDLSQVDVGTVIRR